MDRSDRLKASTGELDVLSSELNSDYGWGETRPKARHLYEGTDSEEESEVIDRKQTKKSQENNFDLDQHFETQLHVRDDPALDTLAIYRHYQLGQLAPEETQFCPLAAVKKYPYAYIGLGNKQLVAETFFDKSQLLNDNTWDLFYIYKNSNPYSDTIILVPTAQFVAFLSKINDQLNINLTIPRAAGGAFEVPFEHDGTPCPRYLGRSESSEMAEKLKATIPPSTYRLKNESEKGKPTDQSLEAFRRKIELLQEAQKNKKKAASERKKAERIVEKQQMRHSLKRVQRYLGLQQTRTPLHALHKGASDQLEPTTFTPDRLAPFVFEGDVVFVCVDIEAYEFDQNKITEIGISTLDTRDIARICPGNGGKDWYEAIRARHFRINDYKHLNNTRFVTGCADRFEFGESEFIPLKDASATIASCFRHPFSKIGETSLDDLPKRNVVLVGHDIRQDVAYMRKVGFEVYNMSNLMEEVDTAAMWRYTTRDANLRSLGSILADLGIVGWNLHNAGNDAAYTLQAMISIAVKAIVDKQKGREVLEKEKEKRISDAVEEAEKTALEREAEWNSGVESDGGEPIKPELKPTQSHYHNTVKTQSTTNRTSSHSHENNRNPQEISDKQDRAAQNSLRRRGWERDEAANDGGWATANYTQPETGGGWGMTEAYEEGQSEPSVASSRWGGLQSHFVSAGFQGQPDQIGRGSTMGSNTQDDNDTYANDQQQNLKHAW